MFTGIITHLGHVRAAELTGDGRFTIEVPDFTVGLALGASIACNGACLTATAFDAQSFTVQVSRETLERTSLSRWEQGTVINLERAMKLGDELGGHMVTGHVDGLATLEAREEVDESTRYRFKAPPELAKFVAAKGSATLNGVSLTVNRAEGDYFEVNLIPHTKQHTNLGALQPGDDVNLEIDIIARYLARLQEAR